jgi:hypothetical protein
MKLVIEEEQQTTNHKTTEDLVMVQAGFVENRRKRRSKRARSTGQGEDWRYNREKMKDW